VRRPVAPAAARAAAFRPWWPPVGLAAVLTAALLTASATPAAAEPVRFADIPGWAADDHAAALVAFRAGCRAAVARKRTKTAVLVDAAAFRRVCATATALPAGTDAATARRFFESGFRPVRITSDGFLTGYFEPEVAGALAPGGPYRTPLYRRPPDLVDLKTGTGALSGFSHARRDASGRLSTFDDRAAIEAGALSGRGLELVWLADPVDAFFVHVQGSARVRLPDGRVLRVGYDGKNGHPYTAIGRILIDRGEIAREDMTADRLAAWLKAHPREAGALMAENRSFVFFRPLDRPANEGPVGALGVPLVAGRSLAVDPSVQPYGVPVFVAADLPIGPGGALAPFRRLMAAHDTGSAIKGAGRGDIFVGAGDAAGTVAGRLRHPAEVFVLVPRDGG
jgi:membrane-bound lytic murein transglycosylase A